MTLSSRWNEWKNDCSQNMIHFKYSLAVKLRQDFMPARNGGMKKIQIAGAATSMRQ
jgi:hypothetical protein